MTLPKGWEEAPLLDVVDLHDSRRLPLNAAERATMPGDYPYYGANGQVGSVGEGAIITMVEAYVRAFIREVEQRPDMIKRSNDDAVKLNWNEQCKQRAADKVEEFRQKFYPGQSYYPSDIHSYIAYRIGIEMLGMHKVPASEMGLDQEGIFHMVEETLKSFNGNYDLPKS